MLPYTTSKFEQNPVKAILTSTFLRQYAPLDSILRACDFSIWYKYSQPQKCSLMNAKHIDTAPKTCACTAAEFRDYVDADHGHVVTTDLNVLQQYPELRQALSNGTAFIPQCAYSELDWDQLLEYMADTLATQARRYDNLPPHVYTQWKQAFCSAVKKHSTKLPTQQQAVLPNATSPDAHSYNADVV